MRHVVTMRRTVEQVARVYVNAGTPADARKYAVGMMYKPEIWHTGRNGQTEILSITEEERQ